MPRDRVIERVVDQRRLAGAGNAGHADEQAHRQIERDVLQVVAAGAVDAQHPVEVRTVPARRHRNVAAPREVLPGERMRRQADFLGSALGDHLPAVLAGARPHVDDVVGGADRVVVVLDDDDAVAEVAQVLERRQQPVVVALMQSDRRLVQHVHHAGQARPDLRRQPDALRLAAGQRFGRAVERQVVEPDVVEELQPALDFLDDLLRDRVLLPFERERPEIRRGVLEREPRHLVDRARIRAVSDLDEAGLAPQPRALALGTGLGIEVLGELLAHHHRVGLAIAPLEVGNDPLEHVLAHRRLAAVGEVGERNRLVAAAVQDDLLGALGKPVERLLEIEIRVLGQAAQHLEVELVAPVPALDRAAGERELRKRRRHASDRRS